MSDIVDYCNDCGEGLVISSQYCMVCRMRKREAEEEE